MLAYSTVVCRLFTLCVIIYVPMLHVGTRVCITTTCHRVAEELPTLQIASPMFCVDLHIPITYGLTTGKVALVIKKWPSR